MGLDCKEKGEAPWRSGRPQMLVVGQSGSPRFNGKVVSIAVFLKNII